MNRARGLALGMWEFVVGDDWRTAVGVGLSIALTALVVQAGIAAWWVLPASALLVLWLSIRRAAREASDSEMHAREPLRHGEEYPSADQQTRDDDEAERDEQPREG